MDSYAWQIEQSLMKEAAVQNAVIDYLHRQDAIFYIDPGGDQSYDQVRQRCQNLPNCELNDGIRIGNKFPDIVGMNAQNEIFAVETKGVKDLRKGIGQATDYRRGVHKSYLAAEASVLGGYEDTALAAGIGTIPVHSDGVIADRITEPNPNITGTELAPVRRALALKTASFESGRFDIPPMYRPENAFLPVLVLSLSENTEAMSVTDCGQQIKNSEAHYSDAPDRPIRLARTLQLLEMDARRNLSLTDHGLTAYAVIKGIHGTAGGKHELQISTVDDYRDNPAVVAFLRDRYFATPPIRLLVKILASQDGCQMEVSKILSEISYESPDVFLTLFCNNDDEFRRLLKDSNVSEREFRERILALTKVSNLYNFVRQLEVLGILATGSDKVDARRDLVVGELFWKWDPDEIGSIGAL